MTFTKTFAALEVLFLLLGVSLPLAKIDEFWFFSSEFSVISLTKTLLQNREYILGTMIIAFGFICPLLKITQRVIPTTIVNRLPLHKFAMVDMFLLSFLIFGGKMSYFYEVNLQIGFYFLSLSLIISLTHVMFSKSIK